MRRRRRTSSFQIKQKGGRRGNNRATQLSGDDEDTALQFGCLVLAIPSVEQARRSCTRNQSGARIALPSRIAFAAPLPVRFATSAAECLDRCCVRCAAPRAERLLERLHDEVGPRRAAAPTARVAGPALRAALAAECARHHRTPRDRRERHGRQIHAVNTVPRAGRRAIACRP